MAQKKTRKRAKQRHVTFTVTFHSTLVRKKWVRHLLEDMTVVHAAVDASSRAILSFVARRGPKAIAQLRELAADLRQKNGITAVDVKVAA